MKPCAKNFKQLSWLAIDALEPQQAEVLRAHVAACPGCRHYLEEISHVAGNLSAASDMTVEMEVSKAFHDKLVRRITGQDKPGIWAMPGGLLRMGRLDWHVAVPVAGLALVVAALFLIFGPWPKPQSVVRVAAPIVSAAKPEKEMAPTFGDYRMLANRSLDALDQELTSEAQTGVASAPVYRVSSLARAISTD